MNALLTINWNPDTELFNILGIPLRYYGLLWGLGLLIGGYVIYRIYKDRLIEQSRFEPLLIYAFLGILIGARLGHCLFYDFDYYKHNILEMLLPIEIFPDGDWKFTGYVGLASHGGTIGLIIALWLYCRKVKLNYIDVLDIIAIGTPIAACCIRIANLMNSEIIGIPTDLSWAFVFERVDMVPRHPAQLYEAIAYFILFIAMLLIYKRYDERLHRGFYFGLCLTSIFTFRFFIEFIKEVQEEFEVGMTFDMGQWLSIPLIIIGIAALSSGIYLDKLRPEKIYGDKNPA
jgi:prolipoprotein diacylglyceryl transferase